VPLRVQMPATDALLPTQLATNSLLLTLAGWLIVTVAGEAISGLRSGATRRSPRVVIGGAIGMAVVLTALLSVVWFAASLAGSALMAAGTPPIVYLFIVLASAVWLFFAMRMSNYGMNGCSRIIAISWATYTLVWSVLNFAILGDGRLALPELMKPMASALPATIAMFAVHRPSGRIRATIIVFSLLSAWAAAMFLTVEHGVADRMLPTSDWLRFPLAGALGGLLFVVPGLIATLVFGNRAIRWKNQAGIGGFFALLGIVSGLAWATARTIME
jgi:hypothetical protein